MQYLVKVRVNPATLGLFAARLQAGGLDRSLIRSETWCLADDPAVGYSVWEAADRQEFDQVFGPWKEYYSESLVREVSSAAESMRRLMARA